MNNDDTDKWLQEWMNTMSVQLKESKDSIKSLQEELREQTTRHTVCREDLLSRFLDIEKESLTKLAIIDKKLTSLGTVVNVYFGIYTAALIVIAEELFRHLVR
jgi:hypothetical protein